MNDVLPLDVFATIRILEFFINRFFSKWFFRDMNLNTFTVITLIAKHHSDMKQTLLPKQLAESLNILFACLSPSIFLIANVCLVPRSSGLLDGRFQLTIENTACFKKYAIIRGTVHCCITV